MVELNRGLGYKDEWAEMVAWRIVGASESPLNGAQLTPLINSVVSKYVPDSNRIRTIEAIHRWYEHRDGRPTLADDTKDKVDQLVLRGAAQHLLTARPALEHDTLFWAVGAVNAEKAAETIRASWSPELVDSLLEYSMDILRVLCEESNVIDPSDALGFKVDSGRAYVSPDYKLDRVQTLLRTDWHRPSMYSGVARVMQLLMTIRPDQFPRLVEKADHPTAQRWALFVVSQYFGTEQLQPLDWLQGEPSEPLISIALVHALETIRELGWKAEHPMRNSQEREEAYATASQLLSGLVNQLAEYDPAESVRWIAELYEHGALLRRMNRSSSNHDLGEDLEEQCIDQLTGLVRQSWDRNLLVALKSSVRWVGVTERTLPLGTVAFKIYEDYPDRANELARIVLEKYEKYISEIIINNDRAYYTLTERRSIEWMRGLGSALAIALPEGETPLDWAITQCNQLPLSSWDADDLPEEFRLAGDVAQIHLTVAIYAVIAMYEVRGEVEPELVRNLASRAWDHCHFLSKQEVYWSDEPELDELAARVAIALGSPSEEWLIAQTKNPQLGPRGLWATVDAYIEKDGYPNLAYELMSSIAARYRNIKSVEISTIRYLAMIWQRLEATEASLKTVETMLEFHQRAMERRDYVSAMNLLAMVARKGEATSKTKRDIRSLYEYLWHNYTLEEEVELKQSVDAILA